MSADLPAEPTRDYDTGDLLAVPEDQRLDHDDFVPDEVNPDEGRVDFSDVDEGDVVVLDTAEDDSPVRT